MAKSITICGVTYASGASAKTCLRDKMNSYAIGQCIPDSDVSLWFEVLQKHEWFNEYVEHGIDHFSVAVSEQRRSERNMVVVNAVGERKPFSYHKYLSRGPLSPFEKIKAALRTEIADQIAEFRAGHRQGHVHHAGKSFLQIMDEWLIANPSQYASMTTEAAGSTGYRLADRILAADWQRFHKTHATLELMPAKENMSLGAGGYQMRFMPPVPLPPPPY